MNEHDDKFLFQGLPLDEGRKATIDEANVRLYRYLKEQGLHYIASNFYNLVLLPTRNLKED